MADGQFTTVSRRSTRVFEEYQNIDLLSEKPSNGRPTSYCEGEDKDRLQRQSRESSIDHGEPTFQTPMTSVVNIGRDMHGLLPKTYEEMGKQVAKVLEASKAAGKQVGGRPLNFGTVIPGVYRSSFPQAEDHEYLKPLQLRTIVTLVKKDYPDGFKEFMQENGIRHVIIDMKGTKKVEISHEIMQSILKVVLDSANHPLLMHCNHGKHRTGCVTAVIRHLSGWEVENVVAEYRNYAEPKARECDINYIRQYRVSDLEGLFLPKKRRTVSLLTTKMARMMLMAASVLFLFWTTFPISSVHF